MQLLALLCGCAISCNSKDTDDEDEISVTPAIVAVKNFYLRANDSVMAKLDSVFFSIDLNTGVIFNADSLPKGTNVTRLIPSITFANTMTKAEFSFLKDNRTDTVTNYLTNPEDSIDFSHPVTLNVTAQDGVNTFKYTIKVNVHTLDPDTLVWNNLQTSNLPARFSNPVSQKTVIKENVAYCLIEEYNGELTIAESKDLNEGLWQIQPYFPGFKASVESFTAAQYGFYMTDVNGELYFSSDLKDWKTTGQKWLNIFGAYGSGVIGIKTSDASILHTRYPAPEGYVEKEIAENFPIYNTSSLGVIGSKWTDHQTAIMAGGVNRDGRLSNDVWAYDGENWAIINTGILPSLEAPMLARYVVYRDTPYIFTKREFDVWMILGGIDEDNEMNRDVFFSYDNGVNWQLASESIQLPEIIPYLKGADVIVAGYEITTDLSEAWTLKNASPTRAGYTLDGYDITWICPYLYIFGGYSPYPDNTLNTEIWRGVLQRLRFTPII